MTLPLTAKQERIWRYIKGRERSPSYDEICKDLGYSSRGELHRTINAIKRKGYVDYVPYCARSLVALDPNIELGGVQTSSLIAEVERRGVGIISLPLHGHIS
jgi:SOS-response transcriptional repressor LexA